MKTTMLIILCFIAWSEAAHTADDFVIIVNEKNPVSEISSTSLAHFYLKETRQWPNGLPVRFFDQKDEAEVKKSFLNSVLKKSTREVELFWIGQKLYTGSRAPLQIGSDSMMAQMVSRFPGAVGYVSPSFPGAPGVKKVELKKD